MNNKTILRILFSDSNEYKTNLFQELNGVNVDEYFDNIFTKLINDWKTKIDQLVNILSKSNEIECIMYLIKKYYAERHASYYAGYYNITELLKTGLITSYHEVMKGASISGKLDIVKLMFDKKLYICDRYSSHDYILTTVLENTIIYNHSDLFKYVFQKCKDENVKVNTNILKEKSGFYNNYEIYKIICVNEKSFDENDLKYPIKNNDLETVRMILNRKGSFVNVGIKILKLAARKNNLEIFELIYKNKDNSFCDNELIKTAAKHKSFNIIKFLLYKYNYREDLIRTACIVSAKKDNMFILGYIDHNCNKPLTKNILNDIAVTAAQYGNIEIIKYAFKKGADNISSVTENIKKYGFHNLETELQNFINNNKLSN